MKVIDPKLHPPESQKQVANSTCARYSRPQLALMLTKVSVREITQLYPRNGGSARIWTSAFGFPSDPAMPFRDKW